jgi:putative zinc finger protein
VLLVNQNGDEEEHMPDDDAATAHLSPERLASYIDGRLTAAERDLALAHFDGCAHCRREMTEGRRVLAVASPLVRRPDLVRRVPPRLMIVVTTAIAAAVVFAVVLPTVGDRSPQQAAIRAPDRLAAEAVPPLGTVSPQEGATLSPERDALVWRSASANAEYRLTILDADGGRVWTTSTSDTSVMLPADVRLTPGSEYFWSVDALLADGRSTTTRVRHFAVK